MQDFNHDKAKSDIMAIYGIGFLIAFVVSVVMAISAVDCAFESGPFRHQSCDTHVEGAE